jgi:hypothetical protein
LGPLQIEVRIHLQIAMQPELPYIPTPNKQPGYRLQQPHVQSVLNIEAKSDSEIRAGRAAFSLQ